MSDPSVQAVPRPGGLYRQTAWLPTLLILSLLTIGHTTAECGCSVMPHFMTATTTYQTFTSPNYGHGTYPPFCHCKWSIASIGDFVTFTIEEMKLEGMRSCYFDYVTIKDNKNFSKSLCRKSANGTRFHTLGRYVTVTFISDRSIEGQGFKIGYRAGTNNPTTQAPTNILCNGAFVTLYARATVQVLHAPGYPGNYPSNCTVHWHIISSQDFVELQVKTIDLENSYTHCGSDSLKIFNGYTTNPGSLLKKLCYSNYWPTEKLKTTGMYATIVFSSDSSVEGKGFCMTYRSTAPRQCQPMTYLTATTEPQVIESPNFPLSYPPNTNCKWTITSTTGSVYLSFEYLNLQYSKDCEADWLQVEDGNSHEQLASSFKLCESLSDPYRSKDSSIMLWLHSDSQVQGIGFKIQYSATPDTSTKSPDLRSRPSEEHDGLPTMAGIMGVVVVVFIVVVIVFIVVRRKVRAGSRPNEIALTNTAGGSSGEANPAYDRTSDLPPSYEEVTRTQPPLPPPPPYSSVALSHGGTPAANTRHPAVFTVSHNPDENKTSADLITDTTAPAHGSMTSSHGAGAAQPISDGDLYLQSRP